MIEVNIKLNEIIKIGDNSLLPLDENVSIAAFANVSGEDIEKPVEFFRYLAQAFTGDIDFGFFDENISDHDLEAIKSGIDKADFIIFLMVFSDNVGSLNDKMMNVLKQLIGNRKNIIISNKSLEINNLESINLIMQMPDLSEISLISTIVELSDKNIEDIPTE